MLSSLVVENVQSWCFAVEVDRLRTFVVEGLQPNALWTRTVS